MCNVIGDGDSGMDGLDIELAMVKATLMVRDA